MTGSKEEAEDILQEVFVSVWKSRHTFDPMKAKITTWLHRITVNRCAGKHRKKRLAFSSLEQRRFDVPDMNHQELPEEVLVSKWEYERLIKALDSLDRKHRPVLVLRYFNDLPYHEIAQIMGIPLGTVKSRINKALRTLREQLSVQQRESSL